MNLRSGRVLRYKRILKRFRHFWPTKLFVLSRNTQTTKQNVVWSTLQTSKLSCCSFFRMKLSPLAWLKTSTLSSLTSSRTRIRCNSQSSSSCDDSLREIAGSVIPSRRSTVFEIPIRRWWMISGRMRPTPHGLSYPTTTVVNAAWFNWSVHCSNRYLEKMPSRNRSDRQKHGELNDGYSTRRTNRAMPPRLPAGLLNLRKREFDLAISWFLSEQTDCCHPSPRLLMNLAFPIFSKAT